MSNKTLIGQIVFILLLSWLRLLARRHDCESLIERETNVGDYEKQNTLDAILIPLKRLKWFPHSCTPLRYGKTELEQCVKDGLDVAWFGDSTIRPLIHQVIQLSANVPMNVGKHQNYFFNLTGSSFKFYWDPFLNSTDLKKRLSDESVGQITVVTSSLWWMKHDEIGQDEERLQGLDGHQETLRDLLDIVESSGQVLYYRPTPPIQEELLSTNRSSFMNRQRVDLFNHEARQDIKTFKTFRNVNVWYASAWLSPFERGMTSDGLHFDNETFSEELQIFLNVVCNKKVAKKPNGSTPPIASTCCVEYPSISWYQEPLLWLSMMGIGYIYLKTDEWFIGMAGIVSIAALCQTMDRYHVFPKVIKLVQPSFFLLFMTILPTIILTSQKSSNSRDTGFLNRAQSEEWRGWMQFVILLYHWSGSSKWSPAYNVVRVLVGMYLFMTGYGHTTYFLSNTVAPTWRFWQMLFRLNILPIILALVLDSSYMEYYFSPLVSFWFVVLWAINTIGPREHLAIKYAVAWIFIAWTCQEYLGGDIIWNSLLDLFKSIPLFNQEGWNAKEWRFRLGLDIWAPLMGSIMAWIYKNYKDDVMINLDNRKVNRMAWVVIVLYLALCGTLEKFTYNKLHAWTSPFVMIAYVIVRNGGDTLRSTHIPAWVWLGTVSLETFVLQFHLWLAQDTKSLLFLYPVNVSAWWQMNIPWWISFMTTSLLFLFASKVAKDCTDLMAGKIKW